MNIKIILASAVLTVVLLFTFDVIKFPKNTPVITTTKSPATTTNTPISLQVPFLNKPGYVFAQRITQSQLIFDNSEKYFVEIFKAPATGIISGIVLSCKTTPLIQNPSFLISTMGSGPEYQTTIIQNTSDNTILYSDILGFNKTYNIPDTVASVNKDTPIYLQKNDNFDGTLSNVQIDVYYSTNVI